MILTSDDIFYKPSRDGVAADFGTSHSYNVVEKPCTPLAFIIDGEVVLANGFTPHIGDNIFLANSIYTSRIDETSGAEIILANTDGAVTEIAVDEMFTAVLLSNPLVVPIVRGSLVNVGWKYDEDGFFITELINGIEQRIDQFGENVL